uniref:Macaca fascicularis brain cDNA clone: QflA-22038, similar to human platelet-activating factor acetylhydrolase, isoform Ib,alpha subunit 45kDa (PAFAH1B1), mRNA, RefSeq: NM_000430.2 n=1 Tax=Macaca fascicularis TaxID=9541 RepID=I7G773_MACFA|nr:unnamed protein product [Macaca fascicularis]
MENIFVLVCCYFLSYFEKYKYIEMVHLNICLYMYKCLVF